MICPDQDNAQEGGVPFMIDQATALPNRLRDRARRDPGAPFLIDVEGAALSIGETLDEAGRVAAALTALGVGADDPVAVMLEPSIEAHLFWIGTSALGAWEVPLNTAYRGPMLSYVLNDCRARVLVLAAEFVDRLPPLLSELEHLEALIIVGDGEPDCALPSTRWSASTDRLDLASLPERAPSDVASVIYTSGTTGPSKGVIVPWGEFRFGLALFGSDGDGTDAIYAPFPANHMSGKCPVYNMAHFGGRVVIRKRFSTSLFWSDVKQFECTSTVLLGGTAMFLRGQPEQVEDADNPLRTALFAPLVADFEAFERRFGMKAITGYGMTEIGWPLLCEAGTIPNAETCGRLREGFEARIVGPDGRDVPHGTVGELWVRTSHADAMLKSYLNKPEATQAAWAEGWFHTGDGFRRDEDGNYYFVDRIKDAIRRRGENISSFEVENYVRSHEAVLDCAAIAVPAETGEDEVMVHVVLKPGAALTADTLIACLEPIMPKFMIPRFVEFCDALPLTRDQQGPQGCAA